MKSRREETNRRENQFIVPVARFIRHIINLIKMGIMS